MIEEAIYTRLSTFAGITAIASTRVYPVKLPQKPTFPCLVYDRVSTDSRELTHSGTNQTARGVFQVSCFALDIKQVKQLAREVVRALHGWKGTVSGERIFYSSILNENDLWEADTEVYMVAVDAEIVYRET